MKHHPDNLALFSMGTEDSKPTVSDRRAITQLILKRDERRVVVAALIRLKPDEEYWKGEAEKWKGVVNFKYPSNRYAALEARSNDRFLRDAEQRIRNLNYEIEALEKQLGIDE